jgi:hypothetical protein
MQLMPSPVRPLRDNLFKDCLDIAAGESAAMASRAMADAGKSLAQAAAASRDSSERTRLLEAASALRPLGQAAIDAFPEILREEIAAVSTAATPSPRTFSFEALELMAEDQVDDTVELIRGQQIVMSAVEPDLVVLNALASDVQGLERVQASSNPLRPEVWVRALHRSLGRSTATPATRALWMSHISRALGYELAALYRRLSQHMMQHGASPAAYRIAAPHHEARAHVKGDSPGPTLRDLKRLLVGVARNAGETQGLTRPAGQTMNGMTVPAAMEALQGMQRADDVVRRMQERWQQGVWEAEAPTPGERGTTGPNFTPAQTLAREVARQMIANVAADARLLPDVQDVVRQLEPALLRLVMHDQRFFVERAHPARQLLEEFTQRSLGWPQPNAPGFTEFLAPLREAVQMLSQMPLEDEEPFQYALQVLRQSWADTEKRKRQRRATMARVLLKADARNYAAAEFAARLRERPDVASAPAHIRRFLVGPWCQVMAANAAVPDPQNYGDCGDIVNDIVWSAQPRLAAQNPARLERITAPLLQAIRSGLASIGYRDTEAQEFVDGLAAAHAKVLGGATSHEPPAPAQGDAGVDWRQESVPWLAPDELAESQLMQAGHSVPATAFQSTQREPEAEHDAALPSAHVDTLQPGHYIEVMVRGSWTRWRLTWSSPHGSMLMFTDAAGQPESMTRQMLEKMVELGAVRLLPSGSVVDGALDAVALAALETSARLPE